VNGFLKVFLGGVSLVSVFAGSVPAGAQTEPEPYEPAFTPAEWEIILDEYRRDPPQEVLTYWGQPWMPTNVVRAGGSGRNRWALFDLGTDDSGNQYRLHTAERRVTTSATGNQRERMFVQVFFANPAARGGIARRNVLMSVGCDHYFQNRGSGTPLPEVISVLAFEDFDGSGNLVDTKVLTINEADQLLRGASRIPYHAAMVCHAQHSYPALVDMLIRGQERDLPAGPSDFDF
jgi:hypothetical protein